MALRLSSAEVAAIERANSTLLSPFAYENNESWRRAASRAVEACIGGDGSSFALPIPGVPLIAATPEVARALEAVDPPPDWVVRALTVRRRELGLTVTDWEELFDANQVKRTFFYNEVVRPQGLLAPVTLLRETGVGPIPATLSVYFADEQSARRHLPRRKELLRLVYPAYCAGLGTYLAFRQNRATLSALAEDAAIGVLFFDTRSLPGRENEFFQRLMESEPERDRVRAEVAHVVRGMFRFPAFDGLPVRQRRANSEIQTSTSRYRIAAAFLEDHSSPDSVKAVVLVERIERKPMDARELGVRFSLTRREIEAAQLLRRGLSSRQIAHELGISVNTARRHIERVLLKLDVHSRTAAAAKLSGGQA
jgi:DNA-binding CsgD family transcriptional regulator